MKAYFLLQYKMTNRKLAEAGIPPLIAYPLGLVIFVFLSLYLFQQVTFAEYLMLFVALSLMSSLSDKQKTDFLISTFGDSKTRQIKTIENWIVALPFVAFLVYKNAFLVSVALVVLAIVLARFSLQSRLNITLPTPFPKHPFEFTVGFRKSFYIFPIAYTLTVIAISVSNLFLGLFALLLVLLTALSYYTKPENEYYIWTYSKSAQGFLWNKVKLGTKNTSLLTLPIVLALSICFPEKLGLTLSFYFLGLVFLWAVILAKYATYPREINVVQVFLLVFSVYFPPLLLLLLPYFYKKSVSTLNIFLNDKN